MHRADQGDCAYAPVRSRPMPCARVIDSPGAATCARFLCSVSSCVGAAPRTAFLVSYKKIGARPIAMPLEAGGQLRRHNLCQCDTYPQGAAIKKAASEEGGVK